MKVKQINASDTHEIRHKMLRKGFPIEDCIFKGDDDDQSFHLGAFEEGKLVSVASFYFDKNDTFEEPNQYRLRGMATLPEHQHKGLSSELLKMAFPIIKQNFCSLLWCNARSEAVGFYQKVGFEKIGEEFEIPTVGPHFLMFKKLDS
ncbi:MAG: GNAT family N-acetyltransferase [Halobacteriovorax sp.]|nr:GNAT family N-acetyltransferase [Halobacteriovorax sp.]